MSTSTSSLYRSLYWGQADRPSWARGIDVATTRASNDATYFWVRGIKYYAPSLEEAKKQHRKYLADERKRAKLIAKQEQEQLARENAKFQGLSFLEGFRVGAAELAEKRAVDSEQLKHEWAKDYHIYTNPDQLCCYCGTPVPTKRIWFFDRNKKNVLAVIGLDGRIISSSYWHPHVNGTHICIGRDASVDGAQALFLGLNPGSAYMDVKDWLKRQLGHKCWWDSVLPHYPDIINWSTQPCGCDKCRYCYLPFCKCIGNLLSRQYPINHAIPPMTRQAFDDLVKWAEEAQERNNWDEKTTIFNANYIASLPVEPIPLPDMQVQETLPLETPASEEYNEEYIEGGNTDAYIEYVPSRV